MKRIFQAMLIALAVAVSHLATAAPDETQRQLIQRAQEAKKKLLTAQAAQGADRQRMMQDHMTVMGDLIAQMQKAKPREGMKPAEMRDWIDEHIKLMHEMMGQMMDEHRMMNGGTGGAGMMGGGSSNK